MSTKLSRKELVAGYVQPALEENLPAIKISKALAKEALNGEADYFEIRVTKDFAVAVLESVESAYERAIIEEQASIGIGSIGQLKVVVKEEATYRNPSDENAEPIVKPKRLGLKLGLSKGFKETLESTAIK